MNYQQIIEWLLEGDQSIRYQVHRDLLESPREMMEMEQMLIEITDGWTKSLLSYQDKMGTWAGKIAEPKWKTTVWVVTQLRRMGLSHHVIPFQLGGRVIFETGQMWDGGYNHDEEPQQSQIDLSAMILSNMAYLHIQNPKREAIFEYIIESQMDDGGWSDDRKNGVKISSFSTTLIVLEALEQYLRVNKHNITTIEDMQANAHEFLLENKLFRPDNTHGKNSTISYPYRMEYNILDALDYFQRIDHRYDKRFEQAIQVLRDKKVEGLWKNERVDERESWFVYEKLGNNSRMLTLKAMRVLKWWANISKYKNK